ncbi:MAG TPA: winged helix-turn-helix domain-containing protein [Candidatus Polarisedimenticolia bacterium]|nr:winged helix-turn-helix domain-containing protein [Candidatus Polarisedimenticolia bacterium]
MNRELNENKGLAVSPGAGRVRFGPFELDTGTFELRRDDRPVRLHGQPARLLALLVGRAGRIVAREEIQTALWTDGTFVDFDQGINQCVRQIRAALGDPADTPRYVETIPRLGYRFVAPVSADVAVVPAAPPAPRGQVVGSPTTPISMPAPAAAGHGAPPPARIAADEAPAEPARPAASLPRRAGWLGVAALGVAIVLALLALRQQTSGAAGPGSIRITPDKWPILAVLPVQNLAGDPERDYLAGAMTEELIARLGRRYSGRIGVIARTSAMSYKTTDKGIDRIARELGADYLLEGSVQPEGSRLRVTAQLIRASDQVHVWAATYDRETGALLDVQEEVAEKIAQALALNLLSPEEAAGSAAATSAGVYDLYLKARHLIRQGGENSMRQGEEMLRQVLAIDAGFAPAYAAFSVVESSRRLPRTETTPKAKEWLHKALALDESLAEAHLRLANHLFYFDYDFAAARAEFERAIAINPAYAEAYHNFAAWYSIRGQHDEALRLVGTAARLDPLHPMVTADIGWYAYFARRWDEAIEGSRRTLQAKPDFYWAHRCIVLSCMLKGDIACAARQAREHAAREKIDPEALRRMEAADDRPALDLYLDWDLRKLQASVKERGMSHTDVAMTHLARGENDLALEALERGYRERWGWSIPFLTVEPLADPLRGDARFQRLLERVELAASGKSQPTGIR